MERLEETLLLLAAAAFLILSVILMAIIVQDKATGPILTRLSLSIVCFVLALASKELSPRNRGRILRQVLGRIEGPITPEQFGHLQQSVGSAGFFNRIGLTGIPLAVALLAVVLSALTFIAKYLNYQEASDAFLNMTTLAVGAFVGALAKR